MTDITPVMPSYLSRGFKRPVIRGIAPIPLAVVAHFDGLCEPRNPGGVATVGWAVLDEHSRVLREFHGIFAHGGIRATNNWAEWVAFGSLLRYLCDYTSSVDLDVRGDSLLVVNQFSGEWQCQTSHLIALRQRSRELADELERRGSKLHVTWVPRRANGAADSLCEEAFFSYAAATQQEKLVREFHRVQALRDKNKGER